MNHGFLNVNLYSQLNLIVVLNFRDWDSEMDILWEYTATVQVIGQHPNITGLLIIVGAEINTTYPQDHTMRMMSA